LMDRSRSICLTVNQSNKNAIALYNKAGYELCSDYETIYLR
jgi:predicted GNAT family acetyltransferase